MSKSIIHTLEIMPKSAKIFLGLVALFSCNIIGFTSFIPHELRSLLDSQFIFSRTIELSYAAIVAISGQLGFSEYSDKCCICEVARKTEPLVLQNALSS